MSRYHHIILLFIIWRATISQINLISCFPANQNCHLGSLIVFGETPFSSGSSFQAISFLELKFHSQKSKQAQQQMTLFSLSTFILRSGIITVSAAFSYVSQAVVGQWVNTLLFKPQPTTYKQFNGRIIVQADFFSTAYTC